MVEENQEHRKKVKETNIEAGKMSGSKSNVT